MRLTVELENKYVAIEIGDIEDETVETEEAEVIRLPVGFAAPANVLDDDNRPDVEEGNGNDEDEAPETDRR